jgi:hypothetical protein
MEYFEFVLSLFQIFLFDVLFFLSHTETGKKKRRKFLRLLSVFSE